MAAKSYTILTFSPSSEELFGGITPGYGVDGLTVLSALLVGVCSSVQDMEEQACGLATQQLK